ncbi:unnamed protein product [Blepharisma stoltei]|uniref:Uncharacterized protein n=1 Tax=Blepharisma stoltei TaxID=1481888 RepID=A0AAU9ITU3_9CILI|nr:unnamed protein product [Blepharisma stoltei]
MKLIKQKIVLFSYKNRLGSLNFIMVKTIFPINPENESDVFVDPDEHFNSLPYSSEIPDPVPDAFSLSPHRFPFAKYRTAREKATIVGMMGFIIGFLWSRKHSYFAYGNTATRTRTLIYQTFWGLLLGSAGIIVLAYNDIAFSPYVGGRRRAMFREEALRHALDAKFKLYENLDKIMHSRKKILKQEFYESFAPLIEQNQILNQKIAEEMYKEKKLAYYINQK